MDGLWVDSFSIPMGCTYGCDLIHSYVDDGVIIGNLQDGVIYDWKQRCSGFGNYVEIA